jgi:hypothetical protein
MTGHETELLGAYVLGVLDGQEWADVQTHLAGCAVCRREVDDLREVEAALGEIPPEAFLDGPPPDGELLLQRTLRQVRGERGRQDRRRYVLVAAAVVLVAAASFGGAAVLGRDTAPNGPAAAPAPAASAPAPTAAAPTASAPTPPGTRTGTATDAGTGATMTVAVAPAAGWVRVHATISGVPPGEQCRLYVVARDGAREPAGSWLVGPAGATAGTTLDSAALMAPADVAAVQAETFAGEILVVVPI